MGNKIAKIISNGTKEGTRIVDEDGKEIRGINSISWDIDTNGQLLKISLINCGVEITHPRDRISLKHAHELTDEELFLKLEMFGLPFEYVQEIGKRLNELKDIIKGYCKIQEVSHERRKGNHC